MRILAATFPICRLTRSWRKAQTFFRGIAILIFALTSLVPIIFGFFSS